MNKGSKGNLSPDIVNPEDAARFIGRELDQLTKEIAEEPRQPIEKLERLIELNNLWRYFHSL